MSHRVKVLPPPKASQFSRFSQHFHTVFQRNLSTAWLGARQIGIVPILLMSKFLEEPRVWMICLKSSNLQRRNLGLKPKPSDFSVRGFLFLFLLFCHDGSLVNGKKFIYWILSVFSLFYTCSRINS